MANSFRKKEEEKTEKREGTKARRHEGTKEGKREGEKVRPQPVSSASRSVKWKGFGKGIKAIRKVFENVFGGGFLRKINIRKNWKFLLMVVMMIIVLIYSNLQVQSKREEIIRLNQEMIVAKDEAMDAIEEGYNIDKQKEREILREGEERGLHNSGYIPYIINN